MRPCREGAGDLSYARRPRRYRDCYKRRVRRDCKSEYCPKRPCARSEKSKAAVRGRVRGDCEMAKAGKRRPRARKQGKGDSWHKQPRAGRLPRPLKGWAGQKRVNRHLSEGSLEMRKEFLQYWSSWPTLESVKCPARFNWQEVRKSMTRILRSFPYRSRVRKRMKLG